METGSKRTMIWGSVISLVLTISGGTLAASPFDSAGNGTMKANHRPKPIPPGQAKKMVTPPPRSSDPDEIEAASLMTRSISGLQCEQAAEALRRLSNQILSNAQFASRPNPFPPASNDHRGQMREKMRNKWLSHLKSPTFWRAVWERLADSFRSCDLTCFDDGVAVGQISGAGYCAASVAVNGLDAPGFLEQAPLPLCQSAISVGCQKGYVAAVNAYEGCSSFTQGSFEFIYKEYVSQDCHLDY